MSTTLESELAQHLRNRADAVVVASNLDDVIHRGRSTLGPRRRWRMRRASVVGVAAAAIVVIVSVVVVTHRPVRQLRTVGTDPVSLPGNGMIAFESNRTVKLIDPTTGELAALDVPGLKDEPPSWAPSGRQFVYGAGRDVTVFDTSTKTTRVVGECFLCTFAWSPDGATIAAAQGSSVLLFDANRSHGSPTTIDVGATVGDLNWSPDSRRILFLASRQVNVLNVGARSTTILIPATSPPHWYTNYGSLAISPDGATIALLTGRPDTDPAYMHVQLMTANIDGSNKQIVQDDLGKCFCNNIPGVTWSPDGTTLALAIPLHPIGGGGFQLYLAKPDGTNLRALGQDTSRKVSWQPVPSYTG